MSATRVPTPLEHIRLVVLDVDGVLTDGCLYYGADGEVLKAFHVHDGLGVKLLMAAGVQVAVISGRRSAAVSARCRELGINSLTQGSEDKVASLDEVLRTLQLEAAAALCVVDDSSDIPLMRKVGCAVAVADAHPAALAAADRVTELPGGRGAVREVCDWLLATRGVRR